MIMMTKRTPEQIEKHASIILRVLMRRGPLRAEPICEATGLPITAVRLPIRKLLASKRIKKHGRGKTRAIEYIAR